MGMLAGNQQGRSALHGAVRRALRDRTEGINAMVLIGSLTAVSSAALAPCFETPRRACARSLMTEILPRKSIIAMPCTTLESVTDSACDDSTARRRCDTQKMPRRMQSVPWRHQFHGRSTTAVVRGQRW